MSTGEEEIPSGRPLSAAEQATLRAGIESLKLSIQNLNDMLAKLLTLNTALIGGSLVAAKSQILPGVWGGLAYVAVLSSLVVTMYGLLPREHQVNVSSVAEVTAMENKTCARKSRCIRIAFTFLLVGLMLAGASAFFGTSTDKATQQQGTNETR